MLQSEWKFEVCICHMLTAQPMLGKGEYYSMQYLMCGKTRRGSAMYFWLILTIFWGSIQTWGVKPPTHPTNRALTVWQGNTTSEGVERWYIGSGDGLNKEGVFGYLAGMVNAKGCVDSAVVAGTKDVHEKFKELSPILTHEEASMKLRGEVYESFFWNSETWPKEAEPVTNLEMEW